MIKSKFHNDLQIIITPETSEILLSPSTFARIINELKNNFLKGEKIHQNTIKHIKKYINNLSKIPFYNMSLDNAIKQITKNIYFNLFDNPTKKLSLSNIHEWQKETINKFDEHPNKFAKQKSTLPIKKYGLDDYATIKTNKSGLKERILNPVNINIATYDSINFLIDTVKEIFEHKKISDILQENIRTNRNDIFIKNTCIPFDSRYRMITSTPPTTPMTNRKQNLIDNILKFQIHDQNVNDSAGNIKVNKMPLEIIDMSIGEIYIPVPDDFNLHYHQVSLLIEELSQQSSIMADGTKFHFLFNVEKINHIGHQLRLTPISPRKKFKFQPPIRNINQITLMFRDPFKIMQYQSDIILCNIEKGSPALFSTIDGNDHSLKTGEIIYIQHNNLVFGRPTGHVVNVKSPSTFNVISDSLFERNNDITLSTDTQLNRVTIFVGSQRMLIPINFNSLG
jgi:hypothetical protein